MPQSKPYPATEPDDTAWDSLVAKLDGSFLQSSSWAHFQESFGHTVYRIHGKDWLCLLIEQRSKVRRYLFAPYGPVLASPKALPAAIEAITALGKTSGYHWLRIEPSLGLGTDTDLADAATGQPLRMVPAHKQIDPLYTRLLDLTADEDTLLAGLSSSTRSLIRKHNREPALTFTTSADPNDIEPFLDMIHAVAQRNNVFFHTDEHFRREAKLMMPDGTMRLEFALLDGKPVACIVMHDFNKVTSYTYAASLPEARRVNASALLLWQAIHNARQAGLERMDLFGSLPDDAARAHPWYGFSSFKRKFGGRIVRRGRTFDIPLSPRYRFYRLSVNLLRRLR